MSRVKSTDWMPEQGILVLIGEGGERVDVPIAALGPLASHAARFMAPKATRAASDLLAISAPSVETVDCRLVQTIRGEKVALLWDLGQSSEFACSIPVHLALELSDALKEASERAEANPPMKQ